MFWGPTHVRSSPNSPQMLEALDTCCRLCKKVCAYRSLWLTRICYARPVSLCPVLSPWWSIHLLSWCWRTALYLCTEGSCTCQDKKHMLNLEFWRVICHKKSWKTCTQVGKWIVLASYALVTWWGWRQRLCPWRGLFPQQCLQVRFPLPQMCNWERWTPEARPHPPQRSTDTQIPSLPQTPLGYLSCCTHSNKQNLFRVPSCINLHSSSCRTQCVW